MSAGIQEVKVSTGGLAPGMFVSRIDRPWLRSPFPLQGVEIRTESDIERLKSLCTYVYVDVIRGPRPAARHWIYESGSTQESPEEEKRELRSLAKTTYRNTAPVTKELRKATRIQQRVASCIEAAMENLHAGKELEVEALMSGVREMVDSVIRNPAALMLISQMKQSDSYMYKHALASAVWCASFGRHLGLDRGDLELLALGGLLLDVGKVKLPGDILSKKGKLTAAEIELVKSHVAHSAEILKSTRGMPPKVVEMVIAHHERHDGTGYPGGLAHREIPIFGRIAGIVDSYDAMTSSRPYHEGRSPHAAMSEMYELRGTLFQPELVEQFIQATGVYPTGSLVELTTGEVGVVTELNDLSRLLPKVMVVLGPDKKPVRNFRMVDLTALNKDPKRARVRIRQGLPPNAYGIDPKEIFL